MKKTLLLFLCLISISVYADARMTAITVGCGAAQGGEGCTASYGSELATGANATDDLGGSEADATTGWTNSNCNVFDSVDTGTPHSGTYHIIATAADNGDLFYRTISGLDASTIYQISFWVKTDGTASATWGCGYGASAGSRTTNSVNYTDASTSYTQQRFYTLFNTQQDTVTCSENNAANNGSVYLDGFSITAATLCYGSELYTHANAANIASESDATTGWTAMNDGTIASEETNSPHNGSSHLAIAATGTASGGAYADIGTDFSLQTGTKYFIRFWARNDGTNAFGIGLGGTATNATLFPYIQATSATYAEFGFEFTYAVASHRYLKVVEFNAGNTGTAYIDGISIKAITDE